MFLLNDITNVLISIRRAPYLASKIPEALSDYVPTWPSAWIQDLQARVVETLKVEQLLHYSEHGSWKDAPPTLAEEVVEGMEYSLTALICILLCVVLPLVIGMHLVSPHVRYWWSRVVMDATEENKVDKTKLLRKVFRGIRVESGVKKHGHPHPYAAGLRTAAETFMKSFALQTGTTLYCNQQSTTAEFLNMRGSRTYYWFKDLNVRPKFDEVLETETIMNVDNDYYIDMPQYISRNFSPHLIYTLIPESAGRTGRDVSHTFLEDGSVQYVASGGSVFQHPLWDYGADIISATHWACGLPLRDVTYHVERYRLAEDRYVVGLFPMVSWKFPFNLIFRLPFMSLEGQSLRRFNPVVGDNFVRMKVVVCGGVKVSTGKVGHYLSATIPADVDSTLALSCTAGIRGLTKASIKALLDDEFSPEQKAQLATILYAFHKREVCEFGPHVFPFIPVEDGVNTYEVGTKFHDDNSKLMMQAFMQPMIPEAYVPLRSLGNERFCIKERVTKFTKRTARTPSSFMVNCMEEYARWLFPVAGCVLPSDVEDIYEAQCRPTQTVQLERADHYPDGFRNRILSVMKAEAYSEPKAPRAISTVHDTSKLWWSCIIQALEKKFKELHTVEHGEDGTKSSWYAFVLTPEEIALKVTDICERSTNANVSDLSRMDGHIDACARLVERVVALRAYHPAMHEKVIKEHENQTNLSARTQGNGEDSHKYNTKLTRCSGERGTSLWNSIVNGFIAWYTQRSTLVRGTYMTEMEVASWMEEKLILGGDDLLGGDMVTAVYEKCCTHMGQEVKVSVVNRGAPGVNFLARFYGPDVWWGEPNSCCDILRQMSKIHVTGILPPSVTAWDKLVEKARSYYLTDRNTPFVGDYVRAVMRIWKVESGKDAFDHTTSFSGKQIRWGSDQPLDVQPPNVREDWMLDLLHEQIPDLDVPLFEEVLNDSKKIVDLGLDLEHAKSLLLSMPLLVPIKPPAKLVANTIVNGDLHTVANGGKGGDAGKAKGNARKARNKERAEKFRSKNAPMATRD